jgi:ketosteroid isomerase-like protein
VKQAFAMLTFALTMSCQMKKSDVQQELINLEKDFEKAVVSNDVDAIGRFLTDDWVIVDPNGEIIDKARFLGVIKSGTLTHELMESEDVIVRNYGKGAVVTALTKSKGKFAGQEFTTQERATDVFVRRNGRWQCVFSQLTTFNKK